MRPNAMVRLAAFVAALTTATLLAQSPTTEPQQPVFRAGVDLVSVHAIVTDSHGNALHGLTKSDFEVIENGHAVPVTTFAEVTHQPAPVPPFPPLLIRDVADNTTAGAAERLVIFLVDDVQSEAPRPLVATLLRQLVHDLGPATTMAIASTSGRFGAEPTEDPAVIHRAIAQYANPARSGPGNSGAVETISKIVSMADALGWDTRLRKVCIVISSPFWDEPYYASADDYANQYAMHAGPNSRVLPALQRSDMVTYAIDPMADVTKDLAAIARATGGFPIDGQALVPGLRRLVSDLDRYYLIGFSPNARPDGKTHPVTVRVTRPGATVRARLSFARGGAPKRSKGDTPLSDLAWNPLPVTDLPLRVSAATFFPTASHAALAVGIEVTPRGATLPAEGQPFTDHVGFGLMAIKVGEVKARVIVEHHADVSLPANAGAGGSASPYMLYTTLPLEPGRYQLRASAISAAAGTSGSVYLMVDVPDPAAGNVTLGSLIIGRAVDAVSTPIADRESLTGIDLPLAPTLDRVFSPADTLRVFLPVDRRDPNTLIEGTIVVLDAADRVVTTHEWRITTATPSEVSWELPLAGLGSGAYRVIASVTGETPGARTERQVGFEVR